MTAVENQVRELVKVELSGANERFPPFHSAHEGWAVILEEVDELKAEVKQVDEYFCFVWTGIKLDLSISVGSRAEMPDLRGASCHLPRLPV